jgi:Caspase domain
MLFSENTEKTKWHYLFVVGTREFGAAAAAEFTHKLLHSFGVNPQSEAYLEGRVHVLVGLDANRERVLKSLSAVATHLSKPNGRCFVYYNGHGDQFKDANGDEADGKDEFWKLMGGGIVVDDEISRIFLSTHKTSLLCMICDHCSSGTMIDARINSTTPWIQISSCKDVEDATASSDGGMFTLFGLIPALELLKQNSGGGCFTAMQLYAEISKRIEIPTQHCSIQDSSGEERRLSKSAVLSGLVAVPP